MVRLSADSFLTELNKMFVQSQSSGKSVFVSQKRVLPRAGDAPGPKVLYRAVLGVRKLSTMVGPDQAATFHPGYASVLKAQTSGLKRVKKDKKKKKSKAAADQPATS